MKHPRTQTPSWRQKQHCDDTRCAVLNVQVLASMAHRTRDGINKELCISHQPVDRVPSELAGKKVMTA